VNRLAGVVGLLLVLAAGVAQANSVLVHFAAFSCKHCAAMERYVPQIKAEMARVGGTYSFAPISLREGTQFAPELGYFAVRETAPALAEETRKHLFNAMYDNGLPLDAPSDVVEWLALQDSGNAHVWQAIPAASGTSPVRSALGRAYRLVGSANVSEVPAFVLLRDGTVIATVQRHPGEAPDDLFGRLRETIRTYLGAVSPTK
jgi:hypothetical protein